jgi:hypothetical protein
MEEKNTQESEKVIAHEATDTRQRSLPEPTTTELVGGFYPLNHWHAIALTFGIAVCLTLTGVWQLLLVAGFLGGFLPKGLKMKRGLLIGFVGGLSAWMLLFGIYMLTTEMPVFLERLLIDIIGLDRLMIPVLFLICSTFGGLFCGLGAINGVLVSRLVQLYRKSRTAPRN